MTISVFVGATSPIYLRSQIASVVVWVGALALLGSAAFELYQRWRIDREPASAWMAAAGICAAVYAGAAAGWVFLVPLSSSVTVDLVDLALMTSLLAMIRRSLSSRTTAPPRGPLVFGVAVAAIGVVLRVVIAESVPLNDAGLGGATFVVAFLAMGIVFVREIWRSADFSDPERHLIVLAVVLATVGRVLTPHQFPQDGLRAGLAAVMVLAASALFRGEAIALLETARRKRELDEPSLEELVRHDRSEQLHEVRAGLAGISSGVRLLGLDDLPLGAERRQHLVRMLEAEVARLGRLVDIPTDEGSRVVDVDAALEPVVARRRLAGQQVHWEPSGQLAQGVPDLLTETVSILLTNAATHAPGASVRVSVAADPESVRIEVSDDGPGVPVHLREQVFERGVTTNPGSSTGLGLSLARRLVATQGGDLFLAERGDGDGVAGASFVVSLPPPVGASLQHPVPEVIR